MKPAQNYKLPLNPRYNIRAISWSDVVSIESDIDKWMKGISRIGRKAEDAVHFGTHVHAMIKHRKITNVPIGNDPDKQFTCLLKDGTRSFRIVGTPDDYNCDCIIEYKSCGKLWSRRKADVHGQLPTYALLVGRHTGTYPKWAKLVSLETDTGEDGEVVLTGECRIITVAVSLSDILKIQARFIGAHRKVQQYLANRG